MSNGMDADFHALPLLGDEEAKGRPKSNFRGLCIAVLLGTVVFAAAFGVVLGFGDYDQEQHFTPFEAKKIGNELVGSLPKLPLLINVSTEQLSNSLVPAHSDGKRPYAAARLSPSTELFSNSNPVEFVNVGYSSWDLMRGCNAVPSRYATGMPRGVSAHSLEDWVGRVGIEGFVVSRADVGKILEIKLKVTFDCRGVPVGGYISDFEVVVTKVEYVGDCSNLFAHIDVGDPINVGTEYEPIAQLDYTVHFVQNSELTSLWGIDRFSVRGDCSIESHGGEVS